MTIRVTILGLCAAMIASVGCAATSQDQAAYNREGYKSAVEKQTEQEKGALDFLAVWTWFQEDPDETLEAEMEEKYMPPSLVKERQTEDDLFAAIAPWNWFKEEDKTDYDVEPLPHDLQAEQDEGLLDALAFWTWFEDDGTITAEKVRKDMSPALEHYAVTREEAANNRARAVDHTTRQIWDDIEHILLLDRPVRLTDYPVP